VLDGNTLVTASVSYNASTHTATITPVSALENSKTYTISVVGGYPGVKDLAGNALLQTFSSTFTTEEQAPPPKPDTTPPTITGFNPANGTSNVAITAAPQITFSEALNASTVNSSTVRLLDGSTPVAATVSYNASNFTATITPAAALSNSKTYTISVLGGSSGVKDAAGNALAQTATSTFTTIAAAVNTSSLWPNSTTPSITDSGESASLELGIRFTANTSGYITGIRFYKSAGNTGTHTAHLWTSSGQLLATATFTSETATGWQEVTFASPVAITAGTTYVASYFAPNGHFAVDRKYFRRSYTNGPLTVPASGGVFSYGSSSSFPNSSYQYSNYWVDVVFATGI